MARGLLFLRPMTRAWLGLFAAVTSLTAACVSPDGDTAADPNAGLLRDFVDGKFDAAGHPLNARVTVASVLCGTGEDAGPVRIGSRCEGAIAGGEQYGPMVASLHVRVDSAPSSGSVFKASLRGPGGDTLAIVNIKSSQLRGSSWIDIPMSWASTGAAVRIEIVPSSDTTMYLEYVEVFPERFGMVMAPGSGVYADSDLLTFELPKASRLDKIRLDGTDITARLATLVEAGRATRATTDFRQIYQVYVGELAPERGATSELELRAGSLASRMQLRREAPACTFEGDPTGPKVLVTGFQPFPADGWHENVAAVAVTSLDPSRLRGAQVMRVVMPVEYDRAAAEVTDMIARCAPDAVISFGQGGSEIALERTAYNLQDTGEVPGGVPDNRGIVRAAMPIDPEAPATRGTLLPLDAIESALVSIGETPAYSTDPGRYICNNVMFANVGAMQARGGVGGFIHLPYTTEFPADVRARFGEIARAAVQATADSLR